MIKQENPNFVASFYAPNPMEVTYWIDLSEDANGNAIKTYDGKKWIPLNNQGGDQDLAELRQAIDNEVNRAKQAEQKLTNNLNNKANKSTTLVGYGITDAYTKLETDAKAIKIAQAECARLVASAPETLNTLDEIAAALGDDPNFATTMTNQLGTKANKTEVYTKSETNNKVNTAVANKVTSTDVTQIKVVNEIPEVGSQTPGILYIKLSA